MTDKFTPLDWMLNENYGPAAEHYLGKVPLMVTHDDVPPEEHLEPFWTVFEPDSGWSMQWDNALSGPQYPPRMPVALAHCGNRAIFVYPDSMVLILDPSENFILGKLNDF